nr:hypothetical protein Itr_chr14CG10350 [Ipomoea trifida]
MGIEAYFPGQSFNSLSPGLVYTRLSFSSAKVDAAILAICPLRRRSLPTPSTLSPAHDVAFAVSVPRRQPPNSSASIAF